MNVEHILPDETYRALIADITARTKALVDFACAAGGSDQFQEAEFENDLKIALGEIGDVWPARIKG